MLTRVPERSLEHSPEERTVTRPEAAPMPDQSPPRPPQAAVATRPAALRRGSRWLARGLAAAGIGLIPWMYYLAASLPASTRASHWPVAWIGLDAMEAAGLIATGCWRLRRDARYRLSAMATAALLVTDAWFDVITAPPGSGELTSLAMAACCELPAAAVCLALAFGGLSRPAGR
jgi:hypothetical protein